jgi:segregation and condensation protein B
MIEDRGQQLRLVEALLFAAPEPLAEAAIAGRLPDGADVAGLLAELEAVYRHRGVTLARVAGKWAMRTAPDLAPHLLLERTVSRKLSRAAVETLAIVAYHQPVTRAEIEEIRGVALSKGTLDVLMESGWIRPKGRRQTPGRPVTWVTTDEFLTHFGLDTLGELPGLDELKAAGLLDLRPSVSLGENSELPPSVQGDGEDEIEEDQAALLDDALGELLAEPEEGAGEASAEQQDGRTDAAVEPPR